MSKRPRLEPPEICPVCGEEVPRNALACRECGADHNSGWRSDAENEDALDAATDDFDYGKFVQNEFGNSPRPPGVHPLWWITGILLLAALVFVFLAR